MHINFTDIKTGVLILYSKNNRNQLKNRKKIMIYVHIYNNSHKMCHH